MTKVNRKNLLYIWGIVICGLFLISGAISSVNAETEEPNIPTSVILMIGDGMGENHIELGRLVEYGEEGNSSITQFPIQKYISTSNIDGGITDSAASGTAIATGVKTLNKRIGQSWNKKDLTSILEIAENNDYNTGLIVKCQMPHATPAAFSAHNQNRNNYLEIAEDIAGQDIEVLLGGGQSNDYFGQQISTLQTQGYNYVSTKSELDAITDLPILGLFADVGLPKAIDYTEESTVPGLLEMVQKGVSLLQAEDQPFFLMIEGSEIDWESHSNNKSGIAHEVIEFEKTVQYIKNVAESNSNLLVLVTADHETGGLTIEEKSLVSPLPNPIGSLEDQIASRNARINEIEVDFSTGGHTNSKVILAGIGPHAELITSAEHHIDTFSIMRTAIEGISGPVGENWNQWYLFYKISLWGLGAVAVVAVTIGIVKIWKKKKSKKKN